MSESSNTRRDFITGKAALQRVRERKDVPELPAAPVAGPTIRLTQRSMACDFSVIFNAGVPKNLVNDASAALDVVSRLEEQLSLYRESSELSALNREAAECDVRVEPQLFRLLLQAEEMQRLTSGAFEPTSAPLVKLWRKCRGEERIPSADEVRECLEIVGMHQVGLDEPRESVRFDRAGVEVDLGGIGKGYALDRASGVLDGRGIHDYLLHGGHSSLLARGDHRGTGGWPVGLGNPLFTSRRLGTILLQDRAMSTSGSNLQFFNYRGKRYGHILDPLTGWPVETMLSVTVLAPSAAEADALSTAFFVMGVEKAAACCDNLPGVSGILIPLPKSGRLLKPVVVGMSADTIFWDPSQVDG